ncbi:hypothetical protein AAH678_15160 [Sodalis endosymbiont of Spalangia cameroni]
MDAFFILVAVMASLLALAAIVCFIRRTRKPTPRYEEEHYD